MTRIQVLEKREASLLQKALDTKDDPAARRELLRQFHAAKAERHELIAALPFPQSIERLCTFPNFCREFAAAALERAEQMREAGE